MASSVKYTRAASISGAGTKFEYLAYDWVDERYAYDAFGLVTILTPAWVTRTTSSYAWVYLHQGGRWDADAGTYSFRFREYLATLGMWTTNDPIGFEGGDANWYRISSNRIATFNDPHGLYPITIRLAAFIDQNLGLWLPEPLGLGAKFRTDMRTFGGKFESSRVYASIQFDSAKVGYLKESDLTDIVDTGTSHRRTISTRPHGLAEFDYDYEKKKAGPSSSIKIRNSAGSDTSIEFRALASYPFSVAAPSIDLGFNLNIMIRQCGGYWLLGTVNRDNFPNYEFFVEHHAKRIVLHEYDAKEAGEKGPSAVNLNTGRTIQIELLQLPPDKSN